nr:hypothetical protein [Tanacetum cinerariifolium]
MQSTPRADFAIFLKINSRGHFCHLIKVVWTKDDLCNTLYNYQGLVLPTDETFTQTRINSVSPHQPQGPFLPNHETLTPITPSRPTTLSQKVESIEANLKQTKQVYRAVYTKLIIKVKKLEKTVKTSQDRRKAKIVVSDEEVDLEDTSKQGRREAHNQEDQPENQLGVLSATKVLADTARRHVQTYTKRRAVSTSSGGVSTASMMISIAKESISTASALMLVSTIGMVDKGSYTLKQLRKLSFDEIKELFEATMRSINDFVPMESEDDKAVPKLAEARSSKRDAEEELDQGRSKDKKIGKSSEPRNKDVDEPSQEELQQLMIIVPEQGMNFEALQTKYLIIEWEIYTKDTRKY